MKKKKELAIIVTISLVMVAIGFLIGYSMAGKSDTSSVTASADASQTSDALQSTEASQASGVSQTQAISPTVKETQTEATVVTNQPSKAALSIMSITEDGDWIVVETTYGVLRYPFAFSDVIEVEAFNEGETSQLRFYTKIEGQKIKNYTIHYNDNEGTAFGTLKKEKKIPLSVVFEEPPAELQEDWKTTFYAVQETFNDVLKSMEENEKFFGVDS